MSFEGITTTISISSDPLLESWNLAGGLYSTDNASFVHELTNDRDIHEAAESWARDKHNGIPDAVRAAADDTVNRAKAGIVAKATGATPQCTDNELGNLIGLNQKVAFAARRDAEYAATAVIARGVLKDHPDTSHIGLRTDSADNSSFVSGAIAYNGRQGGTSSAALFDSEKQVVATKKNLSGR